MKGRRAESLQCTNPRETNRNTNKSQGMSERNAVMDALSSPMDCHWREGEGESFHSPWLKAIEVNRDGGFKVNERRKQSW